MTRPEEFIRDEHERSTDRGADYCIECGAPWPCPAIAILAQRDALLAAAEAVHPAAAHAIDWLRWAQRGQAMPGDFERIKQSIDNLYHVTRALDAAIEGAKS